MNYMQKHISIILVASLLCTALPAVAQESVHVEVRDSVAGLSTELTATGLQTASQYLVLPPFGSEFSVAVTPNEQQKASVRIDGANLEEAGIYTVLEVDENGSEQELAYFEVLPDSIDILNSSVQASRGYLAANGNDTVEVSVITRDSFGNTLSNRPIQLISSRSSDVIEAFSNETDDRGEQRFAITTHEPGTLSLRAIDLISGDVLMSQVDLSAGGNTAIGGPATNRPASTSRQLYRPQQYGSQFVGALNGRRLYGQLNNFDVVDTFILEVPSNMEVNLDENLTITAIDRNGVVVEDYTGTVYLSSTDQNAVLPSFGEVTFRGSDLGQKTLVLGLRFGSPGEHILYAEDSLDGSVNAQVRVMVQGGGHTSAEETISIRSPREGEFTNETQVTIEGEGQPFINLVVTGGAKNYFGETDVEGQYSIPVELGDTEGERTIQVLGEASRDISEERTIYVDLTAPEVSTFTFTPKEPIEGDDILVQAQVLEEGSGVDSIELQINDKVFTLEPGTETGSYTTTVSLTDPADYQPILTVVDAAGNDTEVRNSITVSRRGLPQVQNVVAETKANSVALKWEEITSDDIDGYRIYVGENENDFLYTLDTDRPTSAATVAGLRPGGTYYFAVTALESDRESEQKSEVVVASVLGLTMEIVENDGAVTLNWNKLSDTIPLARYELTYGVDPENLSERRMLNGEMTTYTMRNLINDVTYYIRLTPVTSTGDPLNDIAAQGQAQPFTTVAGFSPGSADPIPKKLRGSAPDKPGAPNDPVPELGKPGKGKPPQQPPMGIPLGAWWFVLTAIVFGGYYLHQKRRTMHAADAFLRTMQSEYDKYR